MDNLDTIKFKESESEGWYYKIDVGTGRKISFANGKGCGTGLYKEMQAWTSAGNEIEPQYTPAESVQKEINDSNMSLEAQKMNCIILLNDSEMHLSNDPPYPDDVESWKTFRAQLRTIIKNNVLTTIPDKPF